MSGSLVCPIVAPGAFPGSTEEDRAAARASVKQQIAVMTGMESCVVKGGIAGVGGFGIGAFFSLMSTSFAYEDPFRAPHMQGLTTMAKTGEFFKDAAKGMYRSGRTWGKLGLLFAGTECIVEGYRGRHDVYNVIVGGFATGGIISRNNGTKAGLLAGAGFAAFGAAIDKLWGVDASARHSADTHRVEREEPDEP